MNNLNKFALIPYWRVTSGGKKKTEALGSERQERRNSPTFLVMSKRRRRCRVELSVIFDQIKYKSQVKRKRH